MIAGITMKWRTILLLSLLVSLAGEVNAQSARIVGKSYLIDGKYLPEPCLSPDTLNLYRVLLPGRRGGGLKE